MAMPSGRVPLQARSVATRALLDAALECLVADGYASLTTNDRAPGRPAMELLTALKAVVPMMLRQGDSEGVR